MEFLKRPLVVALLADGIGGLIFWLIGEWLVGRFQRPTFDFAAFDDAILLAFLYALFLIGVAIIRKIDVPNQLPTLMQDRRFIAVVGIPFAAAFIFVIADITGYADSVTSLDFGDSGNSYYFLVTPAIYLFFGLLYFFISSTELSPSLTHAPYALIGLVAVNIFIGASASYLGAVVVPLLGMGTVGTIVVVYLILLFFFTLPRLIYGLRQRQLLTLISFDILLVYFAVAVSVFGR